MSATFTPCRGVLPAAQQALLPRLRPLAEMGFVLYGGTAVALRLGHRSSVDFDFFRTMPLDRDGLRAALPVLAESTAIQDNGDAWSLLVPCGNVQSDVVKVSFFGSIAFGRVGSPERTDDDKRVLFEAVKVVGDLPEVALASRDVASQ